MKMNSAVFAILFLFSVSTFAAEYAVPANNEALIGQMTTTAAGLTDNVVIVAQKYDVGFNAIANANPHLQMERRFPEGAFVQVPTQHLLPNLPRRGMVINLPEMRMYYYPAGSNQVFTYPIGIGKIGKTIPLKTTTIVRKTKNPIWIPPQGIREFNLEKGIVLPRIMPAGPDNPLGPYAIYTGLATYLIHSTPFPESVGTRASFGCIRMYETDIQSFFPSIKSGTSVAIINQPTKVGWQDDQLYLEAHEPLQEHMSNDATLAGMIHLVSKTSNGPDTLVDWQLIAYIAKHKDGVPHEVGQKIS